MAVIRKLILGLLKVFLLVTALLALVAVAAWFYPEKFLCVDSGPVSADVLVVLGGGVHERPVRAAELFQQHAAPRILLTGAGDDVINRIEHGQNLIITGDSDGLPAGSALTVTVVRRSRALPLPGRPSAPRVSNLCRIDRRARTHGHQEMICRFSSRPRMTGAMACSARPRG